MKLPTLSITVMAHESRSDWFPYLRSELGDVPFFIDDDEQKLGTWGNCRRAWLGQDMSADYGIVIQDDAILCDDFIEKARQLIAGHPGHSYQMFFGNRQSTKAVVDNSNTRHMGYVKSKLMWGVAIALPTHLIREMVDWCDKLPDGLPDDSRIKKFLEHKGIATYYPWPSLVDHRTGPSLVGGKENRFALEFADRTSIPKIIHQIWIGPLKPPMQWISTWKNIEGWTYHLWNEEDIAELGLQNIGLYDYYMQRGMYHGAADVARLEILKEFGGIYIDADTQRFAPWKDFGFLYSKFFAVEANARQGMPYRIANGVIGSQPDNPILDEYIERMGRAEDVLPPWDTIGGTMFTEVLEKYKADPQVIILPPYYFYPMSSRGKRHPEARKALARHHWGSTKRLYQK